ncbi:hypothetical protein SDC9_89277 [bioreactor metagenome]|uniref:Uncharacterized protein n=1 Tax=bioreactor metagenome TaxID=1076179 RepID=A0A644ZRU7_9ZZZZ
MEQLCTQTAANHLGSNGNQNGYHRQQNHTCVHGGERNLQSHACKEDGREEHIGQGFALGLHIDGPNGFGNNQSRAERADDVRHAEDLFGDIGIQKAEGHGNHGKPLAVPAGGDHPLLNALVEKKAQNQRYREKRRNFDQHDPQAHTAGGGAGNQRQQNQAQNVVNQRRA